MIEEFFRFLKLILQYKSEQRYDEALKAIDNAALALMKVKINEIESMTEQELDAYIRTNELREQQLEILADLIKEKAEIYYETNQIFSCELLFDRSLLLFRKAEDNTKNYSMDRKAKMEKIHELLFHLREG